MTFTKTKLSLAVSSLIMGNLALGNVALAADAPQSIKAKEDTAKVKELTKQDIEVIEVSGYRASVQKSLNMKRFSDTIVDAVSAEDVGKFPDQTVADALQRIPGVSVEKDFGESDRVSIRGTAPHLNVTLLNGQNVASSTASASITRPSRGFNYSLLPAELVNTLEVYKSAEADIDEGSIGGTVVVKTRMPLDTEKNYAALSVKGIYAEGPDASNPHMSGVYSWKNDAENFGFNMAVVHKENESRRDSEEVKFGYRDLDGAGAGEDYHPGAVGYNRYDNASELDTYTLTLQYAPNEDLDFAFTNLFSTTEQESSGTYSSAFIMQNKDENGNVVIDDAIIEDGTVVGGTIEGNDYTGYYGSGSYQGEYDTRAHDLKMTYTQDDYTFTAQVGYSKAEGEVRDTYAEFYANTGATFDLTGEGEYLKLDDGISASDYRLDYNHQNDITNSAEEKYLQADFEYFLDNDFISSVKVGAKYRDHNKTANLMKAKYNTTDESGNPITLDMFTDGVAEDFMGGGSNEYLYDFDPDKYDEWANEVGPSQGPYEHPDYYFDLDEEVTAAYVKANFDWNDFRGNLGVRYVKTENTSTSIEYDGRSWDPQNVEEIVTDTDYDDVLPSLNVKYSASDELIFRFAAAKVMSRPDYEFLTSRKSGYCSSWSGCTGYEGNPDLDPYRATQYDMSAEWYFGEASILSVALFYKDIESYIFEETTQQQWVDHEDGQTKTFDITSPVNGEGGVNQGLEINFSQELGYGFGLQANYTYSDADMDESEEQKANGEEAFLPNNSEDTYNMTVYYEGESLQTRISYNYRSEYIYDTYLGLNQFKDGFGQFDLNMSYAINEDMSFQMQVINLTNEAQESYMGSSTGSMDKNRMIAEHDYGRRYLAGFQVKF